VVLTYLVAGAILLGVLGIWYLNYLAAKQRREAMAALAAERGWTYTARDDRRNDQFLGAPFGLGHSRRSTNVLTGEHDGRPFVAFDYVYYTTESSAGGKGRRQVPHPFYVVALDMGASFPPLEVSPENFLERFVGRLTDRDIELESEDFNRAFTVTCPDRKFASDVLHPRCMELLLRTPGAGFRFDRRWAIHVEIGTVALDGIVPRLRRVDAIVDEIPEFVWKQVKP
jgi:hypothetical protein